MYHQVVCRRPEESLQEMHRAARSIGRIWRSCRITMRTVQSVTSRIPSGLPMDIDASLDMAAADSAHPQEEVNE